MQDLIEKNAAHILYIGTSTLVVGLHRIEKRAELDSSTVDGLIYILNKHFTIVTRYAHACTLGNIKKKLNIILNKRSI